MKNSRILTVLTVSILILSFAAGCGSSSIKTEAGVSEVKNPITEQVKSDLEAITISITYDSNFTSKSYSVETGSSLPDTSSYSTERGVDRGMIEFPCTGELYKRYVITQNRIVAVVKTKYDMSVLDRTDYVFTKDSLYIINTSQRNSGLYTGSEVYVLPAFESKLEYDDYFASNKSSCHPDKKLFNKVLNFIAKNNIKF
jgi:hypothetical protein